MIALYLLTLLRHISRGRKTFWKWIRIRGDIHISKSDFVDNLDVKKVSAPQKHLKMAGYVFFMPKNIKSLTFKISGAFLVIMSPYNI
jgi:hypothetical protein